MTTHTFRGLGVSEPVSEALARRDEVAPFAIQQLVLPVAEELGQDRLIRLPLRQALQAVASRDLIRRRQERGR